MQETSNTSNAQQELESFGYAQQLDRTLNLSQLTAFGLNYMMPISPLLIFGLLVQLSGGTVAIPFILAGIAISVTAASYIILLRNFPLTGSLYSYVGRGLNQRIGFLMGWVLLLDYILIPTTAAVNAAINLQKFFPSLSYELWLIVFSVTTGVLNILGVKLMARLGFWLLVLGELVIFIGLGIWIHSIITNSVGVGHVLSLEPFHYSSLSALATATSLAVFSYLGFDAITTLAEEAKSPKRDIPRAIVLSILISLLTMFLIGYFGMLLIPNWQQLVNTPGWLDTTMLYLSRLTGGYWFSAFYLAGFVLAAFVFNIVATAAGARLLFGMGRDDILPKAIFGAIHPRWKTPYLNILLIILIEFTLGTFLKFADLSQLINYGAILGFVAVNFTVVWLYYFRRTGKTLERFHHTRCLILPILGLSMMIWIFSHLQHKALLIGSIWLITGIIISLFRKMQIRELHYAK